MTADPQGRDAVAPTAKAIGIRKDWGWFLALGIVQVLAGALAVGFVFSATLASVVALGVLLLIAGSTQMAAALLARRWDGFFLFLLHGFLYGVAGFLTLEHLPPRRRGPHSDARAAIPARSGCTASPSP